MAFIAGTQSVAGWEFEAAPLAFEDLRESEWSAVLQVRAASLQPEWQTWGTPTGRMTQRTCATVAEPRRDGRTS